MDSLLLVIITKKGDSGQVQHFLYGKLMADALLRTAMEGKSFYSLNKPYRDVFYCAGDKQ
jgi:hypothetical protein